MQDFKGKVAVITGGASGVGRSLAWALGRRGARIAIADIDRGALDRCEAELKGEGIEARAYICDVRNAESCKLLAESSFSDFGAVHLVFANAGVGAGEGGPLWNYSEKDWQWSFSVNVWGVINTINAFVPRLLEQGQEASFVVTGSGNGAFLIYPDAPIYTTTKAAVHAITEELYYQVAAMDTPLRVHALFPGPHVVDTGLFDSDRVRPAEFAHGGGKASGIRSVDDMKRLMAQYGVELQTTHPDEVAETALRGISEGRFWILPMNEQTEQKLRDRLDMILRRENPVSQVVGG